MKKRKKSSTPSKNRQRPGTRGKDSVKALSPEAASAQKPPVRPGGSGSSGGPVNPEQHSATSFFAPLLRGKARYIVPCLVIAVITFLAFSSILDNEFVNWDDPAYFNNRLIKSLSWANIKEIFSGFHKQFFSQPMVLLSFAVEYHFFHNNPTVYHTTNLLLHIINSFLVFYLVTLLNKRVLVAFVAAALFAIHPLHVESVAWMAERKDVLSGVFFISAMIFYVLYRKSENIKWLLPSFVVFTLALFTKTIAVTLPFVLVLFDYLERRDFKASNFKVFWEKLPFFALSIFFAMTSISTHDPGAVIDAWPEMTFFNRNLVAIKSTVFYLYKTIAPFKLAALYPYPKGITITKPEYWLSIIVVLVIAVILVWSVRKTRVFAFGILFFCFTIGPVLNIVPHPSGGAGVADRYMYLPSIGLFFMVAMGFDYLYRLDRGEGDSAGASALRQKVMVIALLVVIFVFSMLTFQRGNVWQSSETLWTDSVKNYPDVFTAHNNLGLAYSHQERIDEAIEEYKEALRVRPGSIESHNNLGLAYKSKGRIKDSIAEFAKVLKLDPNYPEAYNNLGLIFGTIGQGEKSVKAFKKAVALRPGYPEALYNLGLVYAKKGKSDLAISYFSESLKYKPDFTPAISNIGTMYAKQGKHKTAVKYYQRALFYEPANMHTHYNLAFTYKNLGMRNKAAGELVIILKAEPDNKRARKLFNTLKSEAKQRAANAKKSK